MTPAPPKDLRRKLWQGGALLVLRHLLTALMGLATAALAVAWAGLGEYGLFAGALGIVVALAAVGSLGLGTYLLQIDCTGDPWTDHQAFSLLGVVGLAAALIGIAAVPWIGAWMDVDGFEPVARAMIASLPLVLLARVAQYRLERTFAFRALATTETLAATLRNGTAIALLAADYGAWALVIGWWIQYATLFFGLMRASGYRPRWIWRASLLRPMLAFGLPVWGARSALGLRELINPLLVGRTLGSEAIGQVAIALTLCEVAAMLLGVAARLSDGLFGALRSDPQRTASAISEGTFLQLWLVGPVLVGLCWAGSWLFPRLLGPEWVQPMALFPLIALSWLATSLTQLHTSALYTAGRGLRVLALNTSCVALFASVAALALPTLGIVGFGLGSAAGAAGLLLLGWPARKHFTDSRRGASLASAAAFALALFVPQWGPLAALGLVFVLAAKPVRQPLIESLGVGITALLALSHWKPTRAEALDSPARHTS